MKRMIWTSAIDEDQFSEEFWKDEEENLGHALSEDERYELVGKYNELDFHVNEVMLDEELPGSILAIASVGTWQGRVIGYKLFESKAPNLKEILYPIGGSIMDYEVFCDGYNVRSTQWHHDGTNYIEYRLIPEGVDPSKLLNHIYNTHKELSREMIRRYTRSLRPYIAKIYGW